MTTQNNCYYFEDDNNSPIQGFFVAAPTREDARKHLAKRLSLSESLPGFWSVQMEKDAIASLRVDLDEEGVCRSVQVAVISQG